MPRTSARGGPQTRARIVKVANPLFLERGFDAVTVAEIARLVGVSSVTVFNHFPTKEDLFIDRADETIELVRAAVRDRATGVDGITALEGLSRRLSDEHAALAGLNAQAVTFFRTIAASPTLIVRARQIAADIQRALAEQLSDEPGGDLLAAFFVAGYSSVFVESVRRLIAGEPIDELAADHASRLDDLFAALRGGLLR